MTRRPGRWVRVRGRGRGGKHKLGSGMSAGTSTGYLEIITATKIDSQEEATVLRATADLAEDR